MQWRVEATLQRCINVGQSHEVLSFLKIQTQEIRNPDTETTTEMINLYFFFLVFMVKLCTCSILSWTVGVRGVRSPADMLVTLYSDRSVDEAELPLSLSSAA